MINTIEQLDNIGWMTVITVIVLIITLLPQAVESWKKFLSTLGLISKKEIKQTAQEETIEDIKNDFENLKKEFEDYKREILDKQEVYHNQSIQIRDNLKCDQDELKNNQICILDDVKNLKDMFEQYMEIDNKRTIATLRTHLWRLHKDFTEQNFITPDGLKTFKEMGKVYEEAGGDDIYHDKLQPEVLSLEIRYPDGSIYEK